VERFNDRLKLLESIHKKKIKRLTSQKEEDYLEVIYELIKWKGYAKVKDIAKILNVKSSTVSKMLNVLSQKNLVVYEKYGGIVLTENGIKVAEEIIKKHKIIFDFLILLKVNSEEANIEAETIEHVISENTINKIGKLHEIIIKNEEFKKIIDMNL